MPTTAERVAELIRDAFNRYRTEFGTITLAAKTRFENAQWLAGQQATTIRLESYKIHQSELTAAVRAELRAQPPEGTADSTFWPEVKAAFVTMIRHVPDAELAETFYNSLYRNITGDAPVNDNEMFVWPVIHEPADPNRRSLVRVYRPTQGVVQMIRDVFNDLPLERPWQNLERDIGNVLRSLMDERPEILTVQGLKLEILKPIFYRNKGAYLIGRLFYYDASWPVALPFLLDDARHIYVDTLICDPDELSIVFSFTRAYFMVDVSQPAELVRYLNDLLPNKTRSELYATLGLHKHGKTEFYRGFLDHLSKSTDRFEIAPGTPGLVMAVFMLPSYGTVFKVIKDRFSPQKQVTAAQVKEKYHIVKRHDRVGRMADTQEFQNFALPRDRFDPALLDELKEVAASSVEINADTVLIRHLYTERLMRPLNLYIKDAEPDALENALDEYGNAIKQLAAANIFPGDMLLKNFGVTRHGRVVFYDYDEIAYITDCNFRAIPASHHVDDEMSADPWYSVAPNDVFPEEFSKFLFGNRKTKARFIEMHGELFDPVYWQTVQSTVQKGGVSDVFPYRRKRRFVHQTMPERTAPQDSSRPQAPGSPEPPPA